METGNIMNTDNIYESFPKIACLASLELEQLANNKNSSLEFVEQFLKLISNNLNLEMITSPPQNIDFVSIDPLTGYAVRQALNKSIAEPAHIENVTDLIKFISVNLITPLNNIIKDQQSINKKQEYKNLNILSDICLSISQIYSSLQYKNDEFESHPLR